MPKSIKKIAKKLRKLRKNAITLDESISKYPNIKNLSFDSRTFLVLQLNAMIDNLFDIEFQVLQEKSRGLSKETMDLVNIGLEEAKNGEFAENLLG